MPIDVPLWMLAISVAFTVSWKSFWWNWYEYSKPSLNCKSLLFFAYPSWMSGDKVWVHGAGVDGYSGATILGDLASSTAHTSLSWSPIEMIIGNIPGSVGNFSDSYISGAAFLMITGIGSTRIILSTFLGGFFMAVCLVVSSYVRRNKIIFTNGYSCITSFNNW